MAKDLITPGVEVAVYADGKRLKEMTALSASFALGGVGGDRCILRATGTDVISDTILQQDVQTVEVRVKEQAKSKYRRIFWGQTSGAVYSLAADELQVEARIARFHFGKPLDGMLELHPNGKTQTLPLPPVFNPVIDGRTRGNMNDQPQQKGKHYVFIDPESLRTENARRQQRYAHTSARDFAAHYFDEMWTVPEAVLYLCWTLNAEEKYLLNPKRKDLEDALSRSPELLRGVPLRLGMYLGEALDVVLGPLGFLWWVEHDTKGKPELRFGERNQGEELKLNLQQPGKRFDVAKNNIADMQIATGTQSTINQVRVLGGLKQYEVTLTLEPGWDSRYDELSVEDCFKDSDGYQEHPEYRDVHRKFVLNEAGDYVGLRSIWKRPFAGFKRIFGHEVVPRRRRAYPCLTLGEDGRPIGENGFMVRWRTNDGEDWRELDELQQFGEFQILHDEIGVRFNGLGPPVEFMAYQGYLSIQLTCTVVDDGRLEYTANRDKSSPQSETAEALIEAADRFQFRKVHKESRNYVQVQSKELKADEQDDTDPIKEYADRLREAWDQADLSAATIVIGLEEKIELGRIVKQVTGRGLGLECRGPSKKDQRYPQVVGKTLDFLRQSQTLQLETMRDATA